MQEKNLVPVEQAELHAVSGGMLRSVIVDPKFIFAAVLALMK